MRQAHKKINGYSLVEMLIVIVVFSILSVLTAQSIALMLRSHTKTTAATAVKQNLDYAASVMERRLRGSSEVVCDSASYVSLLKYRSVGGNNHTFECINNRIYSSELSDYLTSDNINVDCAVFNCPLDSSSININLTGFEENVQGSLGANVTVRTRIFTRDY